MEEQQQPTCMTTVSNCIYTLAANTGQLPIKRYHRHSSHKRKDINNHQQEIVEDTCIRIIGQQPTHIDALKKCISKKTFSIFDINHPSENLILWAQIPDESCTIRTPSPIY